MFSSTLWRVMTFLYIKSLIRFCFSPSSILYNCGYLILSDLIHSELSSDLSNSLFNNSLGAILYTSFCKYKSFEKSAKCLDYRRLGKQRVEVYQILLTLKNGSRWENHPAVKMWKGYEIALAEYGFQICQEWINRGYKDTLLDKIFDLGNSFPVYNNKEKKAIPSFIGNRKFHQSHQSNLLRKFPEHYSKYFSVPDNLPYIWPVNFTI